jgi:hypothetical protein
MQKPLVKNASDEGQIKNAQIKEKLVFESAINDMKFILAIEQGRRFIWSMLSDCGIYSESADQSGSWTYYKEGRRSIGLKLLSKIMDADPDAYLKMMKESKKEKN